MNDEGGPARGRWGTAIGLTVAVVFLSVFDAVPLVALPLAVLLMAIPSSDRWKTMMAGIFLWIIAIVLPGGELGNLGRGWALLLASAFLSATLLRPTWGMFSRAISALGVTFVVGTLYMLLSGSAAEVDWLVREHYQTVSSLAAGDMAARVPQSGWVQELSSATGRMAVLQWTMFPALLALQSLAALALASWWFARLKGVGNSSLGVRPLREFRFSDQLVWLVVVGLALLLIPGGDLATRMGYNALLFMGSLYALRGVGVFVFLVGSTPSWFAVVFGALATIFLYPLILTAAVLVGLGDTWLDVRGRAALATRPDA
ncbi:hypothetical protein BH23GEM6_BH23GEM6_17620 [soil metagenome]